MFSETVCLRACKTNVILKSLKIRVIPFHAQFELE